MPFPLSLIKYYYNKKIIQEWQEHWSHSTLGRDTYSIIKKVDTDFICNNQVSLYFASGHGSFPSYLYKIKKRQNNICICGKEGNVTHYIFGKCTLMRHHFKFDNRYSLRRNLYDIIFDQNNYNKLRDNYNILNRNYSFIKYYF